MPLDKNAEVDQRTVNTQRSTDTQQAANTIASAIREAIKPVPDKGCKDRSDRRDSELCAQWKAADAARDAAKYALWALLLSVVGTAFLILTFRETSKTARRQLRAYISIKPLGLKIVDSKGQKAVTAGLAIKNGGQTPAYELVWSGNIVALSPDIAPLFFSDNNDAPQPMRDPRPTMIHATEQIPADLDAVDPISSDDWDQILNGTKHLYLYGIGEYRDVFRRRHESRFCFMAEHECMRDAHINLLTKQENQAPLVWQQAPFFNRAT